MKKERRRRRTHRVVSLLWTSAALPLPSPSRFREEEWKREQKRKIKKGKGKENFCFYRRQVGPRAQTNMVSSTASRQPSTSRSLVGQALPLPPSALPLVPALAVVHGILEFLGLDPRSFAPEHLVLPSKCIEHGMHALNSLLCKHAKR